jgi:hypothetical protein
LNDPKAGTGGTAANGINDFGVVGGNYDVPSGLVFPGFASAPPYSKESFTTVEAPGAVSLTNIWSLNLWGAVTGYYLDASDVWHGFASHPPYANYTTFDAPGACSADVSACQYLGTLPISINIEGAIDGTFYDASGVAHGFVSYPPYTRFVTIDAPGACSSGAACTNLGTFINYNSLNDFGGITGYYLDASQVAHGFVSYPPYSKGHFTTFDAPGACSDDQNPACTFNGTASGSVNLLGVITGVYFDAQGLGHAFVSYPPYTKSTFTSFDAPASIETEPTGINLEGEVAGFFYDASDVAHGFVSRPPYTTATTFDAPNACSSDSNPACAFSGTFVYAINLEGVFVGFASDASGNRYGFVAR